MSALPLRHLLFTCCSWIVLLTGYSQQMVYDVNISERTLWPNTHEEAKIQSIHSDGSVSAVQLKDYTFSLLSISQLGAIDTVSSFPVMDTLPIFEYGYHDSVLYVAYIRQDPSFLESNNVLYVYYDATNGSIRSSQLDSSIAFVNSMKILFLENTYEVFLQTLSEDGSNNHLLTFDYTHQKLESTYLHNCVISDLELMYDTISVASWYTGCSSNDDKGRPANVYLIKEDTITKYFELNDEHNQLLISDYRYGVFGLTEAHISDTNLFFGSTNNYGWDEGPEAVVKVLDTSFVWYNLEKLIDEHPDVNRGIDHILDVVKINDGYALLWSSENTAIPRGSNEFNLSIVDPDFNYLDTYFSWPSADTISNWGRAQMQIVNDAIYVEYLTYKNNKRLARVDVESPLKVERSTSTAIYPNPNAHQQLHLASDTRVEKVSIFNVSGHLVRSEAIPTNAYSIDVSSLRTGIYIVELTLKNGKIDQHKFIKQ